MSALLLTPVIAGLVSAAVLGLLLATGAARWLLDQPNARSLHATPTPRCGGLAVIAGVAAGWWWSAAALDAPVWLSLDTAVWLALAALMLVSLVDDLRGAPVLVRFPVHLAAAGLAAWSLLGAQYPLPLVIIAAFAIAWMTNLYNFMDGADGLAGGMALIGFGAYAAAAAAAGDLGFAAANAAIAAAAGGFLVYNFPPARVFLGDVGAIPLGFLAATIGVMGAVRGDWPWWVGGLVFAPFIIDASITLARRLLRRASVWQAHREHYYQRLVRSGWTHRRTALAEFGLMTASGALAVLAAETPALQGWLLAGALGAYAALLVWLEQRLPPAREAAA